MNCLAQFFSRPHAATATKHLQANMIMVRESLGVYPNIKIKAVFEMYVGYPPRTSL